MGLAVIDAPPGPLGWEAERAHLIRIVDPLGHAIAWFAPNYGAACVGFAVRPSGQRETEWAQVFHSTGTSAPRQSPTAAGGVVGVALCPPHADRDPTHPSGVPGAPQPWQFIERGPTTAVFGTTCPMETTETTAGRQGEDTALALRLAASLNDGALTLALAVHNHAPEARRLRLGLYLSFAHGLFNEDNAAPRMYLPERPAGLRDAGTSDGDSGIRAGETVTVAGARARVTLTLHTGVRTLLRLPGVPAGPLALALLATASPDQAVSVSSGETFHVAIALRVTPVG